MTAIALRPFLAADGVELARLFSASIDVLAEDDYSDSQRNAWAACADDLPGFIAPLARALTLVATVNGDIAGFASLQGDSIEMLYVHPDFVGQNVGSTLLDALERLARVRGVASLSLDASDNARAFFEKYGYAAWRRNTKAIHDEWLANTTMKKQLGETAPVKAQPAGAKH